MKREFNYRDCYAQAEYHHHGHHGHHHHHPGAHPGSLSRGDGPQGPLPTYQRRGSLQLWQFLVALLDDPANTPYIAWTGRGLEFKLIEPEEVSMACFKPNLWVCTKFEMFFCRLHTSKKHKVGERPKKLRIGKMEKKTE